MRNAVYNNTIRRQLRRISNYFNDSYYVLKFRAIGVSYDCGGGRVCLIGIEIILNTDNIMFGTY